MKQFCLLFLMIGLTYSSAIAQDRAPSPAATVEQKVGLTDITVTYSRPSVKGRTIFADSGLVPYGKTWRTGANAATKITFSDAVKVEGAELAAGEYAITTVPGPDSWKINFYPYKESRWTSYNEATPSASVTVSPGKLEQPIESFIIAFDGLKDYSATMMIGWENTIVPVGITVN